MVTLIYPENRQIAERDVIAWARDRMIDNAVEVENLRRVDAGQAPLDDQNGELEGFIRDVDTPTLEDAIERLTDDGVATFRGKS